MSNVKQSGEIPILAGLTYSDTLLAVTPSGLGRAYINALDAIKSTTFILQSSISSGWIRIGYFDVEGCVVLSLFGRWGVAIPQHALLCATGHVGGNASVCRMENILSYPVVKTFTKGRIVKTTGASRLYLDVYFSTNFSAINVSVLSGVNFFLTSPQLIDALDSNQTAFETSLIGGG